MKTTSAEPGSGDGLTRRERQIMEIVHAEGQTTARTIWENLPDAPTYATVRTLLRVLEKKKRLRHHKDGKTFVYEATRSKKVEGESNLKRVVQSFFSGSVEQVMSCLLTENEAQLDDDELNRLEEMIQQAKKNRNKAKS